MKLNIINIALVACLLFSSVAAQAKAFKGLINRRAVNDSTVVSAKVIDVKITAHKASGTKLAKGMKHNKKPARARSLREIRIVNVNARDLRAGKGGVK